MLVLQLRVRHVRFLDGETAQDVEELTVVERTVKNDGVVFEARRFDRFAPATEIAACSVVERLWNARWCERLANVGPLEDFVEHAVGVPLFVERALLARQRHWFGHTCETSRLRQRSNVLGDRMREVFSLRADQP